MRTNTNTISIFLKQLPVIDDLCLDSELSSYDTIAYAPLKLNFKTNIDKAFRHDPRTANKKETCLLAQNLSSTFRSLNIEEIYRVLSTTLGNPLGELFKRACTRTYKPSKNFVVFKDREDIIAKIDLALEKGTPASIGYNSDMFFDPELYAEDDKDIFKKGHTSIVVGKRYNCETDQNEYIIRNSWGKDSCKIDRSLFLSSLKSQGNHVRKIFNSSLEKPVNCRLKCSKYKDVEQIVCKSKCKIKYKKKVEAGYSAPFDCDAEGHHIVPGKHLKKFVGYTGHYN